MANYTAAVQDPTVYQNTDFDQWVQEGYEKAKPLYEGIQEYGKVPPEYLEKNIPIAYEQILIGGYRLYYVIDYIFNDSNNI